MVSLNKAETGQHLEEALKAYKTAYHHWEILSQTAKDIYLPDVTFGERAYLRGHWFDRLPAIADDIALMTKKLEQIPAGSAKNDPVISEAIGQAMGRPNRIKISARHTQPTHFKDGQPIELQLSFDKLPKSARLYYRHVNQGERYQSLDMKAEGLSFKAEIPADYTNTDYPLEYYFELRESPELACLYPGFNEKLDNQPYFVIRKNS